MSNITWREPKPQAPQQTQAAPDGKAIASLVLGIVGLTVLPFIGSILAINFGRTSISNARKRGEGDSAMATAGVILGWIGVAASVIFFVLWIFTW
jgi:hypothetical protein